MKKLLLVILLIVNTNLFSQVKKQIDSLEILLKNTKKDVVKIKIIEQLGELTYESDSVKFNYYKKQLKALSYKLKSDLGFVKLYIFEGADHYIHGRTNKSIISFKKALFFSKKAKSDVAMATCYNNIAGMESVNSNYKIAISNYMESLKIHEKRKDLKEQFSSLRSIIDLYIVLEDFTNVEKYIHKALPLLPNSKNDVSAIFRFYQNLGTFYRFKGNYELSIEYLKKSINLVKVNYQGLNNNQNGFAYVEIALTYLKVKDYKNAKLYLDKCSLISKQDPGFSLISHYNQVLTQYYLETKDFQKAKEANSIAKINFEKYSNEKGVLVSYQNGEKIAIAQKNYWQAYLNKVEAEKIEKNISSREIKLAIAEIDIKYESLKKEKLLAINKSEAKIRNILLIFTTILILLLIFSGYLIFRKQQMKFKQKIKENELQEALSKIETQNKLQEQRLHISRDLHDNIGSQLTFISSSVDNIKYGFDITNPNLNTKIDDISGFAKDTIVELRETIWAMNNNDTSFEDLQIKITILVNKAKEIHTGIHFDIALDQTLKHRIFKSLEIINIYRCVQEALNNSLKYAQASQISIQTTQVQDQIQILIQDNGKGFNLNIDQEGNGLINMKKRITDIGGVFNILSTSQGTQIIILI